MIVTVGVLPDVVTVTGFVVRVQLPAGNPLRFTLPVGVVHVGCVIIPTITGGGTVFTVMTLVLEQPVDVSVKVSVTVPALTPVTKPAFVIVARPVLLLVQVPPMAGVTLAVPPTHTIVAPPRTGKALTVSS